MNEAGDMSFNSVNRKERGRVGAASGQRPLAVWAERHPEPDWDRYIAALVALALRRVEEAEGQEEDG